MQWKSHERCPECVCPIWLDWRRFFQRKLKLNSSEPTSTAIYDGSSGSQTNHLIWNTKYLLMDSLGGSLAFVLVPVDVSDDASWCCSWGYLFRRKILLRSIRGTSLGTWSLPISLWECFILWSILQSQFNIWNGFFPLNIRQFLFLSLMAFSVVQKYQKTRSRTQ